MNDIPSSPALAPAQLKAALWADPRVRVHALVLGRRVPGLVETLAGAQVVDYDCLWPGALSPVKRKQAPYLVCLKHDSEFTDWLLNQAAADFGGWGVLLRSDRNFLALRGHCRELCRARLPDGEEIALDWMDPPVLRALFASASPDQVEQLMTPLATLVIVGAKTWTFCSQQYGRLQMRKQPVMTA